MVINTKAMTKIQTSDPSVASPVEIYYQGHSHPDCLSAKYRGNVNKVRMGNVRKTEELLSEVKEEARRKLDADIICGAKIEYSFASPMAITFYGTAMQKS